MCTTKRYEKAILISSVGDFVKIDLKRVGRRTVRTCGPEQAKCFPANAMVTRANGSVTSMDSLQAGDLVLDAAGQSTPFLLWIKKEPQGSMGVTNIFYQPESCTQCSSSSVTMSHKHLIFTANGIQFAQDVMVGEKLYTAEGTARVVAVTSSETSNGLFAPMTASGSLIVDGVLCSNYAEFEPADVPFVHAYLAPLRWLYRVLPNRVFSVVAQPEQQNGFHWYVAVGVFLWEKVLQGATMASLLPGVASLLKTVSA